jgi:ribosome-binding factor A
MSKRVEQVNDHLRTIIGNIILKELELPPGVFATITKVKTAPDLRTAQVFLSIIPDDKSVSTFKYLNKRLGLIQHLLGKEITFRYIPKIFLKLDYTERQAFHIEGILDKLEEKD